MSKTREERVNDALSQIVDRILPTADREDEADSDERFYQALETAKDIIQNDNVPSTSADVTHVGDLIKQKFIRENDTPDTALEFSNLFSRLLSQPVLSQKWAILYLLYKLSNSESSPLQPTSSSLLEQRRQFNQADVRGENGNGTPNAQPQRTSSNRHDDQRQSGRVFDEAFSRVGIPHVTSPRDQQEKLGRLPASTPKRSQPHQNEDVRHEIGNQKAVLRNKFQPSEANLLRELPFTLQGVSSSNLTFSSHATLKMPTTLPAPIISLLHSLAEPSLLYRNLSKFQESTDGGLVGQSLQAAIGLELRSYLSLVATLEGQIRRALATIDDSQSRRSLGKAGVTLRRMVIWTRDATMGLRLMNLIVEEFKSKKGGQLISLIHSFSSSHGDPFVRTFAERLLTHVTKPFYDMLRSWIYDGELSDPYLEFFVTEHQAYGDDAAGKGGAISVWEDKYKLNEKMIPTIMTEEFARKVFLIGKSLNFIRYGCGDSEWVERYSKEASRELRYGDTATLESSIDKAYKTTMAQLISLMNDKFRLNEHLTALKKYLLLGQGDFVAILMESLSSNLDRPANSQYRHTLTAQLEHSIRNSNAQYDSPDVLRRLDARMLELSHGEVGWDVFTLEYKIDAPVDVIITPYGSKQYLKVFNFLWRVKRVEYALGSAWRRCTTGARGALKGVSDIVGKDWKTARCAMAEMIHFVCQLQYYILFEVIEASWEQLQASMAKPDCTLDDLIQAHAQYLRAITRKGLLGSNHMDFTSQLHELLKVMLAYKDAVDGLYSYSVAEDTRRQEKSMRGANSRTAQGKWVNTSQDEGDRLFRGKRDKTSPRSQDIDSSMPPPLIAIGGGGLTLNRTGGGGGGATDNGSILTALRHRLTELTNEFRARVCGLLGDLAYQPDPDMRFLGVVMNFNDTYKLVRRSKRKPGVVATEDEKRKEKTKDRNAPAQDSVRSGGVVGDSSVVVGK